MEDEGSGGELPALAERLVELREEKRYVEGEIESVSAKIAAALGAGAKELVGSVEIRVSKPRPGLRVITESDVPAEFLTAKPDRKLLMAHIESTGEVPMGVEVTEGRSTVFAKLKHASSDD